MAIQFACPACNQPIEVDDEHADRQVSCPYCQCVVTAPAASTLHIGPGPETDAATQARPLSTPPADPQQPPSVVELPAGGQRPAWTPPHVPGTAPVPPGSQKNVPGMVGVICGLLAVCLYVVTVGVVFTHRAELGIGDGGKVDSAEMQKRVLDLMQDLEKNAWLVTMMATMLGAGFSWLGGLICSIIGMSKRYRSHTAAIVGLIISMGFLALSCAGFLTG